MLSNFKANSRSQGTEETWVPFLESPDNFSGPESYFMFAVFASNIKVSINDTMKPSVNEAKLTGLWAMNCATIQQVLILKFEFGVEKLTDLSRNSLQKFEDNEPQYPYIYRLFLQHHKRCSVWDISSRFITIVTISIDFLDFSRRFELPNRETLFQWKSEIFNYDQLYTGWNPTFVGHLNLIGTKAAFNILIHSKQWMKCGELFHQQMLRLPGHLDCFIYLFFYARHLLL